MSGGSPHLKADYGSSRLGAPVHSAASESRSSLEEACPSLGTAAAAMIGHIAHALRVKRLRTTRGAPRGQPRGTGREADHQG